MPTGYTAKLSEGEQSFREFVLTCARAFGAFVMMREDPLDAEPPEQFKPSDYHKRELETANAELTRWTQATLADAERDEAAHHANSVDSITKSNRRTVATAERYQAMLAKVADWAPPTPDHQELKAFMVQQLKESLRYETPTAVPARTPPADWLAHRIQSAKDDVAYHANGWAEEQKRTAQRNQWIAELRRSVGDAAPAAPKEPQP